MTFSNHPAGPNAMPPDPFDKDYIAELISDSGVYEAEMFGDGPEEFEPLTEEERSSLQKDLKDLRDFAAQLAPRGIRGVVVDCLDCQETHYFDWSILRERIERMLNDGVIPTHEPAINPNPEHYVTWDYCAGFLDGLEAPRRMRRSFF